MTQFGKVYYSSLSVSLGHFCCIYDNRTIKFKDLMNNWSDFNVNPTNLMYHLPVSEKGINSVKLLLILSIFLYLKIGFCLSKQCSS